MAVVQTYALSGLGGIGKTQTAIEYAYCYGDEYEAVLWAQADTYQSLTTDFLAFADLLNLPEKQETDQRHVVASVISWLYKHQPWLLILDNVDDLEMVKEFLPSRNRGHILLTTRCQSTGPYIKGIEVGTMGREEGILLLLRRAKLVNNFATCADISVEVRKEAEAIYDVLDGLPLALDQAAAYIEENQCSFGDYLLLYSTNRAALLRRRGSACKKEYPKSVMTTWVPSFERVEQINAAAADLLRLFAFLYPNVIPEAIVTASAAELGAVLKPVAEDPILFNDAIGALRRFSLIGRWPKTKTLTIHRLVQAFLIDSMGEEARRIWMERAIRVVHRAFPEVEFIARPQ